MSDLDMLPSYKDLISIAYKVLDEGHHSYHCITERTTVVLGICTLTLHHNECYLRYTYHSISHKMN